MIKDEKSGIRKKYKALRGQMDSRRVSVLSGEISKHIMESGIFQSAEYMYAYYPLGNEADVRPVVEAALEMGKHVAFPKVSGEVMDFFEIRDFSRLHPGAFGIMEPEGDCPVYWCHALVLTPGIAFDKNGNRMGYGKGYYDRYLAEYPECVTVGVAYGLQLTPRLPAEETDVPLDYIATESGVWKIENERVLK